MAGIKILFAVDSRPSAGFGHVSRCLTLARALLVKGARCALLAHPDTAAKIAAEGIEILNGEDVRAAARAYEANVMVIDGYGLPARHAQALHDDGRKLAVIDDDGLPDLPIDLVVNPNAHARDDLYRVPALTGPAFAFIRPEFEPLRAVPRRYEAVRSVLVCMGGADPDGVSLTAINGVLDATGGAGNIQVRVVLGPFCSEDLRRKVAALLGARGELLNAPDNFPAVLAAADIAVLSGGVVLTEAVHLGIPSVALIIADNQRNGVAAWVARGVAVTAAVTRQGIAAAVTGLCADGEIRMRLGARARDCVDGQGAERVADAIMSLVHSALAR
jgi:spore coat polysaccharide biosynthesis predicted glycosyltransferase SpsG